MKKFQLFIVVVFPIFFFLLGILILKTSIQVGIDTNRFSAIAVHAAATVVDMEKPENSKYDHPVVEFTTADNRIIRFVSKMGSNPPIYEKGQAVEVLYDPADPQRAQINSPTDLWFGVIVGCFMGVVFSVVGFGVGIKYLMKIREEKWLLSNGVRIQTEVKQVDSNKNLWPAYTISLQYIDKNTHETYIFKSDPIWYDPTEFVGESVTVLVDPVNYKKYYVDLSFLPKKP